MAPSRFPGNELKPKRHCADHGRVHPTPIYEFLASLVIFMCLLALRRAVDAQRTGHRKALWRLSPAERAARFLVEHVQ